MNLESPQLTPLALGTLRPAGWLRTQLRVQADGLTGHLDEFWPSIRASRWIGGGEEGWERGPYWLDGLIPLAVLLDDPVLLGKARRWIDHILAHQHEDGWLGEKKDRHEGEGLDELDPWPLFVLFKAFLQWHDATGDVRIVPALRRCAARIHELLLVRPLHSWARMRWPDFVLSLQQLHALCGDDRLLELARLAESQGYDWHAHFRDLPSKEKTRHDQLGPEVGLVVHGVNNAMAVKAGAVRWRQSGDPGAATDPQAALAALDRYHGSATGMFHADEHLAGLHPSQGFETCSVVEMLFSLEVAGSILGLPSFFDRLEKIAYNALPASCRADMWAHQYHQQTNQIRCSVAPRDWTDAWHYANIFGQDTQFRCCQANLHQGWPKFAASLWMRHTGSGAPTATAYAPCTVHTEAGGTGVVLREETDYPFHNRITIRVEPERPARFPLRLRIPAWAAGARVTVGDAPAVAVPAGGFHEIERTWRHGDTVELELPFTPRLESRPRHSASLWTGPLLMVLPIKELWRPIPNPYEKDEPRARDWEIHPGSDWNYGLSPNGTPGRLRFAEQPPGALPFGGHGTVSVEADVRRLPGWVEENHSAPLPPCDAQPGPVEKIRLAPYGCCRLRMAEFPLLPR